MLKSYGVGILAVVLVSVLWVGVQRAWLRVFPRIGSDPDALARRMGTHGCGCAGAKACDHHLSERPDARERAGVIHCAAPMHGEPRQRRKEEIS